MILDIVHTAIRVLVADDHPSVRAGVKDMLTSVVRRRACLVDEVATTEDALFVTSKVRYDVVLMDYKFPALGGPKATHLLMEQCPMIPVIGFSNYTDRFYVKGMVDAGAKGYVDKTIEADELYGEMAL